MGKVKFKRQFYRMEVAFYEGLAAPLRFQPVRWMREPNLSEAIQETVLNTVPFIRTDTNKALSTRYRWGI